MTADDRDDDSIHKVNTVPPPDGDADAYSAETKVGPATQDAWVELIRKANEEGERNAAAAPPSRPFPKQSNAPPSEPTSGGAPPSSRVTPKSGVAGEASTSTNEPLPRVYSDEDDDKEDAPTKLSAAASDRWRAVPRPAPRPPLPPAISAPAPTSHAPPPSASVPPAHGTLPPVMTAREASMPPAAAVSASLPPPLAHRSEAPRGPAIPAVKPFAFPPGDPAAPIEQAPRTPYSVFAIAIFCFTLLGLGLALFFLFRR